MKSWHMAARKTRLANVAGENVQAVFGRYYDDRQLACFCHSILCMSQKISQKKSKRTIITNGNTWERGIELMYVQLDFAENCQPKNKSFEPDSQLYIPLKDQCQQVTGKSVVAGETLCGVLAS